MGGVFTVVDCVARTGQGRLELAQNRVAPSEFGQVAWLGVADDSRHVDTTGVDYRREAARAVTGDHAAGSHLVPARGPPDFDPDLPF